MNAKLTRDALTAALTYLFAHLLTITTKKEQLSDINQVLPEKYSFSHQQSIITLDDSVKKLWE